MDAKAATKLFNTLNRNKEFNFLQVTSINLGVRALRKEMGYI